MARIESLAQNVARTLFALAILNFVAFAAASQYLGGDALNGKIENGHYYLGSHGRFTEVDAGTFSYSRFHARSVFVTHPLALLAGALLVLMRRTKQKP